MAKGFGVKREAHLGYILVLMPQVNAYAGKFSLDFKGSTDTFIGIVSQLEDAQVWKSQKLAKQAIDDYYAAFLVQQLERNSEVSVEIKRLKRSPSGQLKTEMVESLQFYAST